MRAFETSISVPISRFGKSHFERLAKSVQERLERKQTPVRLAVVESATGNYQCELGVVEQTPGAMEIIVPSIFQFRKRKWVDESSFNVALLVPTGVGADIGGHAGDAGPVCKLLAQTCDRLITHPNVVNASDINEIPDNGVYLEGSVLSRLLMGAIGLAPVRKNRVLVVIDKHEDFEFVNAAINAVNAARSCYGLDVPRILVLDPPLFMAAEYTSSGRATGRIENLGHLIGTLRECSDEYDAVALSTIIQVPQEQHLTYFQSDGSMVNPWGGVEALLTHALSHYLNKPTAHSPMMETGDVAYLETGVVDPRMAAEAISYTYLQCVLKGLQKSPAIIDHDSAAQIPGALTAENMSCVVIPDGCVGLPTLACLEQGIPVIAVRENRNLMKNDLSSLPWAKGQLTIVENYWEAAGVLAAIRCGIEPHSVRRPLRSVTVETAQRRDMETQPRPVRKLQKAR